MSWICQLLIYCDALNREEKNFEGSEPGPLLLKMDRAVCSSRGFAAVSKCRSWV